MNTDECLEYRSLYDELQKGMLASTAADSAREHGLNCGSCREWAKQTDDLVFAASSMPQFDVSEQLTQNILSAVECQRKVPAIGRYGLLMPATVACIALMVAVFPIDTMEGMLSTGLSFAGLLLIKLAITGAKTEKMVT